VLARAPAASALRELSGDRLISGPLPPPAAAEMGDSWKGVGRSWDAGGELTSSRLPTLHRHHKRIRVVAAGP
jgi:hypothetical protein